MVVTYHCWEGLVAVATAGSPAAKDWGDATYLQKQQALVAVAAREPAPGVDRGGRSVGFRAPRHAQARLASLLSRAWRRRAEFRSRWLPAGAAESQGEQVLIVALQGNIAAGKTSIMDMLAKWGYTVYREGLGDWAHCFVVIVSFRVIGKLLIPSICLVGLQ